MDDHIKVFWEYVRDHHHKIVWAHIERSGTESQGIYMQMIELFHRISPGISMNLRLRKVLVDDPAMVEKIRDIYPGQKIIPILVRYELFISANGNKHFFPVVEKIYDKQWDYQFLDDWLMIKYYDKNTSPIPIISIPFNDQFLPLSAIKFCYNLNCEEIDLILVLSDELVATHIRSQEDISLIRNNCLCYLEKIFGEYDRANCITKFTVVPQSIFVSNPNTCNIELRPMEQINLLNQHMPKRNFCYVCKLDDIHLDLTEISGKHICKYCFDRAKALGLNYTI
jgi:hypothetical protein